MAAAGDVASPSALPPPSLQQRPVSRLTVRSVLCCARGAHRRSHLYLPVPPLQVARATLKDEGERNRHPWRQRPRAMGSCFRGTRRAWLWVAHGGVSVDTAPGEVSSAREFFLVLCGAPVVPDIRFWPLSLRPNSLEPAVCTEGLATCWAVGVRVEPSSLPGGSDDSGYAWAGVYRAPRVISPEREA